MLNSLIEFKNSVINRFGPILGYAILIIGGIAALSILGFLLRTMYGLLIGLIIAGLILFGVYKVYEMIQRKK